MEPEPGLPTVELADDGAPTITVPDAEPPTELIVQPLIEGDGAVVEAGQTITVHYTGVIWDTGAVFDSSWESGSPATFEIGTGAVIPGWDEGLVGQTVGSQILLVVPPAKGYPEGSPDGSIKADRHDRVRGRHPRRPLIRRPGSRSPRPAPGRRRAGGSGSGPG